jgi:hypothetical protein
MPRNKQEGQVSRWGLWIGWVPPFILLFLLLPIYISLLYIMGVPAYDITLAWIVLVVAIGAPIMHFFIPKSHPDWRMNMIYLMIVAYISFSFLMLAAYFDWWNTLWFV